MIENRIAKAWGQGCARSLVIRIVVGIIVLSGFLCLTIATALLPIDKDMKVYVWAGLVVIFMLTTITGVVIWGVTHIRKNASELDQAFTPLGLEGRMYLLNGRQYHGSYQGHPIHAYISRGPTVEIYLDNHFQTRLGIGFRGVIEKAAAHILDRTPLLVDDPAFENLVVYPLDKAWAATLLSDQRAREAVLTLTTEGGGTELRSFSITPAALKFEIRFIHIGDITPEAVRAWVNELVLLTRVAEGLPSPLITAEEIGLETSNRVNRGKFFLPIIGITCGVLTAITICILAITALIIFLEESGL